jgi:hypothetical protein
MTPEVPDTITCVDCGGLCHLIGYLAHEDPPFEDGPILTYRCSDCRDRWDIVWEQEG